MIYTPPEAMPTVAELIARTNETVAGLVDAKRRLAVILRRHMIAGQHDRDYRIPNLLMIGPTGGGKTHLTRAMLTSTGLPFVEVNATQYSEVGYAGLDLSSMFMGFWPPGEKRREATAVAERWGVVLIDEIDKWRFIANPKERQPQRALQAELLRMVEGDTVRVRERDSEVGTPFRTHHILFIGMGAFEGLDKVVDPEHREQNAYVRAEPHHIVEYGFLEELVGRFATLLTLPMLDEPAVERVLLEHIWPAYVQQAQDEGFTLAASPGALRRIANIAVNNQYGARAIQPQLEKWLERAWAMAGPGDVVRLDVEHVGTGAVVERAEAA